MESSWSLLLLTFLLHFVSSPGSNYVHVVPFDVVPQFLDFFFFFVFVFQFGKFLLTYLQAHWFFPWLWPVYWWIHQSILHFCYSVLISSISFWFLEFPSLPITHLFLHIVFFTITVLNIIIVIENFLSDTSTSVSHLNPVLIIVYLDFGSSFTLVSL